MTQCRHKDCNAPIFFATTEKGRQMPLDVTPNPDGKWVLDFYEGEETRYVRAFDSTDEQDVAGPRYTSHFETCPYAKQFTGKGKTASPSQRRRRGPAPDPSF